MTQTKINEALLEEKLTALENVKKWSTRTIAKLEALLNSPDEELLYCVNPIRFATEKGVKEDEAIALFLHAAHLGLFTMNWGLICPLCSCLIESFASIETLHSQLKCNLCVLQIEANMDDMIQISFTVRPAIRPIPFHNPNDLSSEDYLFRYRVRPEGQVALPDGKSLPVRDALRNFCSFIGTIGPGETKEILLELKPGFFLNYEIKHDFSFRVGVAESTSAQTRQTLHMECGEREFKSHPITVAGGKVRCEVTNSSATPKSVALLNMPGEMPMRHFEPFLTGKRLITHQTFRDLFRFQSMEGTDGIGIKSLCFLFTDLKGSTEMYDRIGDLKAYSLVQQHFDRLSKVIVANGGAIVKTIGDAVMATFMTPDQAVKSALEMLIEIDLFNKGLAAKEIILKIGIHQGASIVVTLNEQLDYFGQTVNIAARVQGLADAEEIYVTKAAYDALDKKLLDGLQVTQVHKVLRGVQEDMTLFRVTKS